jgi:predicted RNase H-like HicB family nuclease
MNRRLTASIEREGDGLVALCPVLDVVSQGAGIEEARDNLREALELFFVTASPNEVEQRLSGEPTVPVPDHRQVKIGTLQSIIRHCGIARASFEE